MLQRQAIPRLGTGCRAVAEVYPYQPVVEAVSPIGARSLPPVLQQFVQETQCKNSRWVASSS